MTNSGFLTKNTSKLKKGASNSVIAGKNSGKRVLCSQQALPTYNDLVKLANNGNYWANLIVSGISGLSSGRLNKDNIYIEQRAGIAYGKGAFYMVLPGVTATLEEMPNGTYILQNLKADTNYLTHQRMAQKPGLWRVKADANQIPTFQHDGNVLNKEDRPVVISGMTGSDPHDAAKALREDLVEINGTIKNKVGRSGFDMHYTRGETSIVGLKKSSQALSTIKDKEIVESAILLANTMYQARSVEGVQWCSDWGGSAILTRALQILHNEKGVKKLNGHSIFLNRPTSSPKEAIELAGRLGIVPLGQGKNVGHTIKEIRGHIFHTEIGVNKSTGKGLVKTTSQGLSIAGAGYGIAGAALGIAGSTLALPGSLAIGLAGGLFTVGSLVKAASKNLKAKKY